MPFLVPACESEMELVRERTSTRSTRRSCRTHPGRIDEPDFKASKEREVGGQKEERTVARQLVRPVVEALRNEGSEHVVSSEVHNQWDEGLPGPSKLLPALRTAEVGAISRTEEARSARGRTFARQSEAQVTHNDRNVDVLSDAVDTQEDGGHAPDEPGEVRV